MKKFCVYDIEASNWKNFVLGGFFDGENYFYTNTVKRLCEHILKRKYAGWFIYAHYGGGFDHKFVLQYLLDERKDLRVHIIENHGNILCLKVQTENKKYTWTFVDSYQVIKGSLGDLTKIYDVEHKKLDFEKTDFRNLKDSPELRKYLENDCKGLYEVIEKFYSLDLLKGINHKLTTSSLALAAFRQKFLKDTILYKLTDEKEKFVRAGYYGGRTEIFKMKAERVKEYDVNAMYVSAMLELLPCGGTGIWANSFDFGNSETCGFIEAEISCPGETLIPLLPVRNGGKLIFPVGKFIGVYFSAELKEALDLGYEVKILRALIFPAKAFLAEYALNTWQLRQDNPGKNPVNITAKLLGNGIYGKFAQQRERFYLAQIPFNEGCENGYELVFPEFNLWKIPSYSNSAAILPYISAAITSYSRIALHRYLRLYPENVVYCDTDSIFIDDGQELPTSPDLGGLKHEESHKRFIAIQPKFYLAEYEKPKGEKAHKLRAKGFVDEGLNWIYEDFDHALNTGDYEKFFQQQEPKLRKLNESIRVKNFLCLVERKKGVKTQYDKRVVDRWDFTTRPIDIEIYAADQEKLAFEKDLKKESVRVEKDMTKIFRRAIMTEGGINDSDYEYLPRWCKRKAGSRLDVFVVKLQGLGFYCESANDVYEMLWQY